MKRYFIVSRKGREDDVDEIEANFGEYCRWKDVEKTVLELQGHHEQIIAWETASGLITSAGDPDGITPEQAQKYWEAVETKANCLSAALRGMTELIITPEGAALYDAILDRWGVDPESL